MECPICKKYFSNTFEMPDIWWTWFKRDLNGFFGAEETEDGAGIITGYSA